MIHRTIETSILRAFEQNKVVTILGPRQVGKSTLASKVAESFDNVLELNGDDSDVRSMFENIDETKLRAIIGSHDLLLVDEAQKISNVGNMLKITADKFKDIRVIVTGSSSFALASKINESLTGRKRELRMYPLSFREMADYTSVLEETRSVEQRLIFGYYPEVVTSPGNEKEVLYELVNSYLYKDVLEDNMLSRPDRMVKLVQALAFQIGSTVSSRELSALVGLDAKTVDRYIDILEKCFIIRTIPSYSTNLRNELKFSRKIYFLDMGIRNAVIGNFSPVSLRSPEELGHIWKNFIISERIKKMSNEGKSFVRHYFWRTQQKKEVDLIEMDDGRMSGFEFKWNPAKSVKAPSQFLQTYPDADFKCITPSQITEFLY